MACHCEERLLQRSVAVSKIPRGGTTCEAGRRGDTISCQAEKASSTRLIRLNGDCFAELTLSHVEVLAMTYQWRLRDCAAYPNGRTKLDLLIHLTQGST